MFQFYSSGVRNKQCDVILLSFLYSKEVNMKKDFIEGLK